MFAVLTLRTQRVQSAVMDETDIYTEIGRAISARRRIFKWTQADLAQRVGMSRASIANIEVGRQRLLVHQLYLLAAVLKLDDPHMLMPMASPAQAVPKSPIGGAPLTQRQRDQVDLFISRSFAAPERAE
jgi:transcriptional regulator with XRE-family HTH domain